MTSTASAPAHAIREFSSLARRFEAIVFDWDGAGVTDGRADATRVRRLVEEASGYGLELAIVSGTHVGNVDGQLAARPAGVGGLILALNRGSELFSVDQHGPQLVYRRTASAEENVVLSRAAQLTVERLAMRGLAARIVSEGPGRRKIDLIPEAGWEEPPRARIAGLLAAVEARLTAVGIAGLREVVEIARVAAAEMGLAHARVTSDAKHVEIGLTDKSDSSRLVMRWLWERGVAPEQVLIAGDELGPLGGLPGSDSLLLAGEGRRATSVSLGVEPGDVPGHVCALGGGPDMFAALLEDQLARRRRGELPIVVEDPAWALVIEGIDPRLGRAHESLMTLADGRLGTRGSLIVAHESGDPAVVMSGVYAGGGADTHLLEAPSWNAIAVDGGASFPIRRVLDLHAGVLHQQLGSGDERVDALLLSSLALPATAVLRARGRCRPLPQPLEPPGPSFEQGKVDGCRWMRVAGHPASIAAAASDHLRGERDERVLDRVAAYEGTSSGVTDERAGVDRVRRAHKLGFDHLLWEHRRAWASRWEDADVVIEGDADLQLAARLALFHLIASVHDRGEAAVGARGLTGRAYRGHVFWDSDVYVLPFLAATHPPAARAMLEYRLRHLPAAMRAARAHGGEGARFPWESARSGQDVTPEHLRDPRGEPVPILTGRLEEHIVADVAWAAACYLDWTGDTVFTAGQGRELIVQTARWWASRIEPDECGRGHIRYVIGPDEYHVGVDDNAFTNVMARWNLRRAADLGADRVDELERSRWLELADAIVDGYDTETGIYEQFAGFHALEPLLIAQVSPRRPVAADILLGRERVEAAQVVKQADVLMLHYLVPDEVAPGSLEPNIDFYEPRTAHGSTLSPGVHAALLARAGHLDRALDMLRLAARIDLDDIGHMSAGGLHLAAMGSVWRALAFGFAGLRPVGDALGIDPVLPPGWESLELVVRFRGSRVRIRLLPGVLEARADPPVRAFNPAGDRIDLTPAPQTFELVPQLQGR